MSAVTAPVLPCERDYAADLDTFMAAMARVSDRLVDAIRSEDPSTIAAIVTEARHTYTAPGMPDVAWGLIYALAAQVNPDVPLRERIAWTYDIAAVAGPIGEPGPSSASYLSQSAALDGARWGVHPASPTARSAA